MVIPCFQNVYQMLLEHINMPRLLAQSKTLLTISNGILKNTKNIWNFQFRRKAKELGMECVILGILASESYQREKAWLEYGCNVFYKFKDNQCKPLSFWTDNDINEYIKKYNVKIPNLYNMGYERNGCMYCGFGAQLEPPENNRYKKLHETHPLQYDYFTANFGDLVIQFDVNI